MNQLIIFYDVKNKKWVDKQPDKQTTIRCIELTAKEVADMWNRLNDLENRR